jgi:hypothetical protein
LATANAAKRARERLIDARFLRYADAVAPILAGDAYVGIEASVSSRCGIDRLLSEGRALRPVKGTA